LQSAALPSPRLRWGGLGGWGDFAKIHSVADDFNHALDIPEHLVIPEAKHAVAVRLKIPCQLLIGRAVGMLAAIDLDDNPRLVTGKVREIRTNRRLPAKVGPAWRNPAQILPKLFFGIGRIATKSARTRYTFVDPPRRPI
jgi:hypothetical protein